jgi:glutathione-regulated potassium-efflux system ancillary protein KefC/glutathione-regulated potassium-efflux system protein KefB
VLRPVLRVIANTRVQEAFTATALLVVLGTALLFQSAGLSMALGAFLAGVLLADSEYRHELEADVEPFKGLLLGLFLCGRHDRQPRRVCQGAFRTAGADAGFLARQGRAVWLAARLSRYEHGTAWRLGASLAGGGEFAFVLLAIAARDRVIDAEMADRLVIVVTLSMIAAPLVIALAETVARRVRGKPAPAAYDAIEGEEPRVLIAGFGRFGQIVGRVLRARHIRFTALEISPAQVDFLRRFGNKLYYGDASRLEMLRAAGAGSAEVLVLAIDDVEASVRAVQTVRRHFPKLRILARARNRQHAFQLMDAGVEHVWRETFGSSLEMAEQALVELGTDAATAATQVRVFREHDESTLQAQAAVKDDEAKLIASARESARQLESLFEADAR